VFDLLAFFRFSLIFAFLHRLPAADVVLPLPTVLGPSSTVGEGCGSWCGCGDACVVGVASSLLPPLLITVASLRLVVYSIVNEDSVGGGEGRGDMHEIGRGG
jgi:hypothetical protein